MNARINFRGYYSARRGLLHMPMPHDMRDDNTFTGRLYSSFKDQCYGIMCQLGLSGFARSIKDLIGLKKK